MNRLPCMSYLQYACDLKQVSSTNPRLSSVNAKQGWSLGEIGVPALIAWMNKCRAKESVAGTLKDPAGWVELYKKFLGIDYFAQAGVVKE